ncbi:MAG: Fur family transcriptional regulator [Thermincola sp.]|nr:Fur family transcriptional regulator [Thermincola sp.]MDT3703125.1 Fur family transcriptional regulator [Thermincola sp.]
MGEVESLEQRLKNKGYKLTGPRKTLLKLLKGNQGKSLSAQEIFDLLKENGVDFSTVYRNLEMMSKEGILSSVHRENGTSSYELCLNHHHHHLICTDCGATRCIDICPMELINESVWEGFIPKKHRFEIMGVCPECAKKSS